MQDEPTPGEILTAVAAFLRETGVHTADPRTTFHARVAARALDLVRRHIEGAQAGEAAELARLQVLLGRDGDLATLNAALSDALATGEMDWHTPGVAAHLRASTLEKLAVDQPDYSGYRAALAQEA